MATKMAFCTNKAAPGKESDGLELMIKLFIWTVVRHLCFSKRWLWHCFHHRHHHHIVMMPVSVMVIIITISNANMNTITMIIANQSCKNVPTVPTSWCYFFWPVLIFGKNTRKQAKTRENRRKTGAFLVLIFWGGNWSVLIFTPFATMNHIWIGGRR